MTFGGFTICSAFVLAWIVKSQTYTINNNNNDWYSLEPAKNIILLPKLQIHQWLATK